MKKWKPSVIWLLIPFTLGMIMAAKAINEQATDEDYAGLVLVVWDDGSVRAESFYPDQLVKQEGEWYWRMDTGKMYPLASSRVTYTVEAQGTDVEINWRKEVRDRLNK